MGRKRKVEVPVVEDSTKKHVLIAILGITPAVLTEAVWALVKQRNIVPDEIVAFTTNKGKKRLSKDIIASGVWSRLVKALRDEGHNVKGKLKFDDEGSVYLFKDANRKPIEDLRSREDNLEAANMMMKEIRVFAEDGDWVIHALLSGGRKTMTALFFSCMCLQARSCDRIYHVLASENYEKKLNPPFFFPEIGVEHKYVDESSEKRTCRLRSEDAKIDLFEVPFVYMGEWAEQRCRAISKKLSYENLINDVQSSVNKELYPDRVILDFTYGRVEIDGKFFKLSSPDFMVLAFLLQGYDKKGVIDKMYDLKTYMSKSDNEAGTFRSMVQKSVRWLFKLGWIRRPKNFDDGSRSTHEYCLQPKFLHVGMSKSTLRNTALPHDFSLARKEICDKLCDGQQHLLARLLFEERPKLGSETIDPETQVICRLDDVPQEFLSYFFPEDAPFKLRKGC